MKTLFVVCQHGREKTPLLVIKKYFEKKVEYFVANEEALRKRKRFIESDLNRSFPGKNKGTKEEQLAYRLKGKLLKYDQILDLHTTTVSSPMFVITISLSSKHLKLINELDVNKVVYMKKSIANGNSLIDYVRLGVSIEVGKEGSKVCEEKYKAFFDSFLKNESVSIKEYFVVFGLLKKRPEENLLKTVESFKLVKKGEPISEAGKRIRLSDRDFYPIMPGEESYQGILTLMATKFTKVELRQMGIL